VNALAGQLKTRRRRRGKYDHAAQPTTLVMTVMMDDGRCVTIGDGLRSLEAQARAAQFEMEIHRNGPESLEEIRMNSISVTTMKFGARSLIN
jgi:hypothetical protein